MANTFTVLRSYRYGGPHNQSRVVFEGTLVIDTTASGGAAAGDLPASMFNGLTKITRSTPAMADDNSAMYHTTPAYDGGSLMVQTVSLAAADLADDTYSITVEGMK